MIQSLCSRWRHVLTVFGIWFLWPTMQVLAIDPAGTIGKTSGEISIYRNPQKSFNNLKTGNTGNKERPIALYDGLYWLVYEGKESDPVYEGDLIRTTVNSKLVLEMGKRQVTVGRDTVFKVHVIKYHKEGKEADKDGSFLDLMAGKIRVAVVKGDGQETTNVRTKTAVMGVRGTEYYVSYRQNATELATINGAVAFQNIQGKAKSVLVERGKTSTVRAPLTQEELTALKKTASAAEIAKIQSESQPTEPRKIPPKLLEEIKQEFKGIVKNDTALEELENSLILNQMNDIIQDKKEILPQEVK